MQLAHKGVPLTQYIDDRATGHSFGFPVESSLPPSRSLAEAASYIMCYPVPLGPTHVDANLDIKEMDEPVVLMVRVMFYKILDVKYELSLCLSAR